MVALPWGFKKEFQRHRRRRATIRVVAIFSCHSALGLLEQAAQFVLKFCHILLVRPSAAQFGIEPNTARFIQYPVSLGTRTEMDAAAYHRPGRGCFIEHYCRFATRSRGGLLGRGGCGLAFPAWRSGGGGNRGRRAGG